MADSPHASLPGSSPDSFMITRLRSTIQRLHPAIENIFCIYAGRVAKYNGQFLSVKCPVIALAPIKQVAEGVAQRFFPLCLRADKVIHFRGHQSAARKKIHAHAKILRIEKRARAREIVERHPADKRRRAVHNLAEPRELLTAIDSR